MSRPGTFEAAPAVVQYTAPSCSLAPMGVATGYDAVVQTGRVLRRAQPQFVPMNALLEPQPDSLHRVQIEQFLRIVR